MFDPSGCVAGAEQAAGPDAAGINALTEELASLGGAGVDDAERVDRIRALEDLKAMGCAAQARETAKLDASMRAAHAAAKVPARRWGQGVAAQVGLARRESPHRGAMLLSPARALTGQMPHTLAALTAGRLSEHRARGEFHLGA